MAKRKTNRYMDCHETSSFWLLRDINDIDQLLSIISFVFQQSMI